MKRVAVIPGSFDPFTTGHEFVVRNAIPLFDEIYIAIGYNSEKATGFFPIEKRISWIEDVFKDEPTIKIRSYDSLTVEFCRSVGAKYMIRGLRTAVDFEYEREIGQTNRVLAEEIETLYFLTPPELTSVKSQIVRDIFRHGGDVSKFVPKQINLSL